MIQFFLFTLLLVWSLASLSIDFYAQSCLDVDLVVRNVVESKVREDPSVAAVLLRLHFHDCFVQGCDGSILLLLTEENGEINAAGNAGVSGFKVIDDVKALLEVKCPGVVSCANIVVLAARDAVTRKRSQVRRLDRETRRTRVAIDARDLPDPQESIQSLKRKFADKGLSEKDLFLLSAGVHTIGLTACFFVTPQFDSGDPTINRTFLPVLKSKCPEGGDVGVKIPLGWDGEFLFDNHIFQNIRQGKAVIASDSVLYGRNMFYKTFTI